MENKKIWIKANGNEAIATGHIRRCMTIADELDRRGMDVEFILADDDSAHVLRVLSDQDNTVFKARILHTDYNKPEEDFEIFAEFFKEEIPDFFIIDSYYVTPEYIEKLKDLIVRAGGKTKLGLIDDFGRNDYPVDLLINYDISGKKDIYSAEVKLLGEQYAPIRPSFSEMDYQVRPRARRVFVSTGGTDPYLVEKNILTEIYEGDSPCRKVLDVTGLECEVVVGTFFEEDYRRELEALSDRHKEITLHEHVTNMPELMNSCDYAVSAGGATLYELCAVGVPTVAFSMADNQVDFALGFDKLGAVKYAGDARTDHRIVQKIVTWGTAAVDNPGFRKRMSDKARSIIDGKGTEKIVDAIVGLLA